MNNVTLIAFVITTLLTGLSAGFFYAWSCSVMIGLATTDDRTFINTMQAINVAVLNPVFAAGFFGPMIGIPICILLVWQSGNRHTLITTVAALIAYAAACVITMSRNQPMNLALDAAGSFEDMENPHDVRGKFEGPWVRWNHIRTVTSTVALLLLIIAIIQHVSD